MFLSPLLCISHAAGVASDRCAATGQPLVPYVPQGTTRSVTIATFTPDEENDPSSRRIAFADAPIACGGVSEPAGSVATAPLGVSEASIGAAPPDADRYGTMAFERRRGVPDRETPPEVSAPTAPSQELNSSAFESTGSASLSARMPGCLHVCASA